MSHMLHSLLVLTVLIAPDTVFGFPISIPNTNTYTDPSSCSYTSARAGTYSDDFRGPIRQNPSLGLPGDKENSRRPGDDINEPYRPGQPHGMTGIASFLLGFGVTLILMLVIGICLVIVHRNRVRLSEDELAREEENQAYMELNSEEQELYFQSKDYLSSNPYLRDDLTLSQNLLIQEKGVKAWEFVKDVMLTNNDLMVLNRCELNFFKKFECSVQTNLPLPMKNDVYYFESKIFSLSDPESTLISIGLAVKPYPWFRLPGRHSHSISYDSDGYRRYNQPFKITNDPSFPKLIEGDVIGVGYRVRSGTVFFTRNGKKVSESKLGGHVKNFKVPHQGQIFPIVGANNLCSIHVNLGQMGYVFIEGNVKKWGFAPLEGTGPAPPAYNKFNADILLERSEIDDDNNDLSEREHDFPPNFWEIHNGRDGDDDDDNEDGSENLHMLSHDKFSYNAYSEVSSNDERITLRSFVIPNKPPSYNSDHGDAEDDVDFAGPSPRDGTEDTGEQSERSIEYDSDIVHDVSSSTSAAEDEIADDTNQPLDASSSTSRDQTTDGEAGYNGKPNTES